eukprot:3071810-Amphidinium_carterae.2
MLCEVTFTTKFTFPRHESQQSDIQTGASWNYIPPANLRGASRFGRNEMSVEGFPQKMAAIGRYLEMAQQQNQGTRLQSDVRFAEQLESTLQDR